MSHVVSDRHHHPVTFVDFAAAETSERGGTRMQQQQQRQHHNKSPSIASNATVTTTTSSNLSSAYPPSYYASSLSGGGQRQSNKHSRSTSPSVSFAQSTNFGAPRHDDRHDDYQARTTSVWSATTADTVPAADFGANARGADPFEYQASRRTASNSGSVAHRGGGTGHKSASSAGSASDYGSLYYSSSIHGHRRLPPQQPIRDMHMQRPPEPPSAVGRVSPSAPHQHGNASLNSSTSSRRHNMAPLPPGIALPSADEPGLPDGYTRIAMSMSGGAPHSIAGAGSEGARVPPRVGSVRPRGRVDSSTSTSSAQSFTLPTSASTSTLKPPVLGGGPPSPDSRLHRQLQLNGVEGVRAGTPEGLESFGEQLRAALRDNAASHEQTIQLPPPSPSSMNSLRKLRLVEDAPFRARGTNGPALSSPRLQQRSSPGGSASGSFESRDQEAMHSRTPSSLDGNNATGGEVGFDDWIAEVARSEPPAVSPQATSPAIQSVPSASDESPNPQQQTSLQRRNVRGSTTAVERLSGLFRTGPASPKLHSRSLSSSGSESSPRDSNGAKPVILTPPLTPPRSWRSTLTNDQLLTYMKQHGDVEFGRQEIIWELFETEEAFIKSMHTVQRLFLDPMRKRQPTGEEDAWLEVVPATVARLFDEFDVIIKIHEQLADAMADIRRVAGGPLVLEVAAHLRPRILHLEAYQAYVVQFERATRLVDELALDAGCEFGEFVRTQSRLPECGALSLSAFLLKPVQRLTKYSLFFRRLLKATPEAHVDHSQTRVLLHTTNFIIRTLEEVKAREEDYEELKQLETRISGWPAGFRLALRDRRLLAYGVLRRVDDSDPALHIMLSNMLAGPSPDSPTFRADSLKSSTSSVGTFSSVQSASTLATSTASLGGSKEVRFDVKSGAVEGLPPIAPPQKSSGVSRRLSQLAKAGAYVFASRNGQPGMQSQPRVEVSSPLPEMQEPQSNSAVAPSQSLLPSSSMAFPKSPQMSADYDLPPVRRGKRLLARMPVTAPQAKRSLLHVLVTSDVVVFLEKAMPSIAKKWSENGSPKLDDFEDDYSDLPRDLSLVENVGLVRVTSVSDLSRRTGAHRSDLFHLDVFPLREDCIDFSSSGPLPASQSHNNDIAVYLTLPRHTMPGRPSSEAEAAAETKLHSHWKHAFERAQASTLPPMPQVGRAPRAALPERADREHPSQGRPLLARSPSDLDMRAVTSAERMWWSRRYEKVRRELWSSMTPDERLKFDPAPTTSVGLGNPQQHAAAARMPSSSSLKRQQEAEVSARDFGLGISADL